MNFDSPRPLTSVESTVVGMLLSAEFPDADVLREQARSAVAVGRCDCGCPSVYLQVGAEVPAVLGFSSRLAPAEGVVSAAGQEGEGQIILFVDDGRLSYLEYVSFDDKPPSQWPSPDRISVIVR